MLKNILKLEGAQELSKNEQKSISGGLACNIDGRCPSGTVCCNNEMWANLCRKPSQCV